LRAIYRSRLADLSHLASIVHVDDFHHRSGLPHEFRVGGTVLTEIANALRLQLVEGRLGLGKVLFPDRHACRLERIAVSLLALAQRGLRCQLLRDPKMLISAPSEVTMFARSAQ
jgi:hypothetical protein